MTLDLKSPSHQLLLGSGLPLLPPGGGAGLRLATQRVYEKTGTVMLRYEVTAGAAGG